MLQKYFIFILSFLFCFNFILFAQPEFSLNGNGVRAAGMGYAFTGLADDASAISWNTAGLTQLYSPEASVVARFGFGSTDPDYSSDFNVDVTTGSKFQLNFVSLVFPFNVGQYNVVGGIAYRRVFDFTQDFSLKLTNEFGNSAEFITENVGGVDAISPAIGFQLNDMFSVGAAVNFYTGSTDYKGEIKSNGSTILSGESSEDYSGTAIDIGVLVKPSPQFSIGANLNLPHTLTVEEEGYEMDLDVPFFFSLGAAFRASDNLTIATDYKSRSWSNLEFEGVKLDSIEDASSFHVGLEYIANAGQNPMPLRFGFYTAPTTGYDLKGDQVSYNALTAGIGLIMGNLILDGGFEYLFGSYAGDYETDSFGNRNYIDYNVTDFKITIGGVIHFGE